MFKPFAMKYIAIYLLCLFMPLVSTGQNMKLDSLRLELQSAQEVTVRIDLSIDLAAQLLDNKIDSARQLCFEARDLVTQVKDSESKVMALRKVGLGFHRVQLLDTALVLFHQAKELAEAINYPKGLAFTLNSLGSLYRTLDNPELALKYFKASIEQHRKRNDANEEAAIHNNIGLIHMEAGKFDQAVTYFEEAAILLDSLDNKPYQASSLQNLALCERRQGNFDKAILHYEQALQLFREIENPTKASLMLVLKGYVYRDQGNYSRALAANQEALGIRKTLGSKKLIASALSNFASIYELMGDYEKSSVYLIEALDTAVVLKDKILQSSILTKLSRNQKNQGLYELALSNIDRALKLRKETGPERVLNTPLFEMGSIYEEMNQLDSAYWYMQEALSYSQKYNDRLMQVRCLAGLGKVLQKRNQHLKAISTLERANALVPEDTYQKEQSEIVSGLYLSYKELGQATKALFYHERFKVLQDKLFNEENTKTITRLEMENKFDQEKKALAFEQGLMMNEKDAQLRRQRSLQLVTGIALVLAVIFISIILHYYRLNQKANEELSKLNTAILNQKEAVEELSQVKSRFFTNISHELRTPLTIIGGMVEQIKQSPDRWLNKGLKMIERNNGYLLHLVNQTLDLRKIEASNLPLKLIHQDIIAYLRYIVESFHSLAESRQLNLHFSSAEKTLEMDYDEEKILKIVSNLLTNAIKFTEAGGDIYFSVGLDDQPMQGHTPNLKLTVRDTGKGIPSDKLPYVFDRFYQVDDSTTRGGEGTGIGLTLTKELTQLMKGEIEVQSEVGSWTVFTIRLPIENSAPVATTKEVDSLNHAVLSPQVRALSLSQDIPIDLSKNQEEDKETVLIVEDNADVLAYLQMLLGGDYKVLIARNGQEGINKAINEVPDLIISDVMMPLKDGFEVCQTLKKDERTSHIPIVLLTARVDADSKMTGLKQGADMYLGKPFNEEELTVCLKNLLDIRRTLRKRYQNMDILPPEGKESTQMEDAFIKKLKAKVEEHLENPDFGTTELCKIMGASRTQLHLKIKALTNRSSTSFIRRLRLNKSKELLLTKKMNISQVAYEVGFKDPAYFSRTFSEEYGLSPKEFKSQEREG